MTDEEKEELKRLKAELKKERRQRKELTRAKVKSLGLYRIRFQ